MHASTAMLLLVTLGGCANAVNTTRTAPFLKAVVQDALASDFEGSAYFLITPALPDASRREFVVIASDSAGASRGTIVLTRFDGIPAVGRYQVTTQASATAALQGFYILYMGARAPNESNNSFASLDGVIEITEVLPDRVAGSFRITAKRYCSSRGGNVEGSCNPLHLDAGAPEVRVDATFVAQRARTSQPPPY